MQLQKTVRRAKNVKIDMIIGIDKTIKEHGITSKVTGKCPTRKKRVWRKVQEVVTDKLRGVQYFATRNSSGNLEFLEKNLSDVVPVKVHPNTKVNKAKR